MPSANARLPCGRQRCARGCNSCCGAFVKSSGFKCLSEICSAASRASKAAEEGANRCAETCNVDEERVVALRRVERDEIDRRAAGAQAGGDLLLLRQPGP